MNMEHDISKAFQGHLDSNEKLIWTGQPKKGIVFRTCLLYTSDAADE